MRNDARIRNEQNRDASRGADQHRTEGQRSEQKSIELKRGGSQRQKIRCTFIREVRTIALRRNDTMRFEARCAESK